ncbi:DUF2958 domain-containing protein [Methylorubrum extorquens]|uniref:DUF2958 domain-containing protein n=1 Tax=Methylorubrum extorquens TaxID=408 RepID=UPI000158F5F8|nr:DUF2958 domain-containing protein [Methylorubrum extorquens]ABY28588.1 conserved hypothetical protein [Methylorubrum extorquens PA1]KQP85687.1 single-stranded DNA endonuclease [Methylobacterium sp. Leaf119]WIU39967.1 DUF2958 domain-containing protein [Methylorubrum extorquens]
MPPLIDAATRELLLANGREPERDHHPVLKLFNPMGPATWLICAMEADGDTLYGLCDLGFCEPELGYVSLDELKEVSAGLAIGLERDLSFRGTHPISVYAQAARGAGRIVELGKGPDMNPRG